MEDFISPTKGRRARAAVLDDDPPADAPKPKRVKAKASTSRRLADSFGEGEVVHNGYMAVDGEGPVSVYGPPVQRNPYLSMEELQCVHFVRAACCNSTTGFCTIPLGWKMPLQLGCRDFLTNRGL